MRKIDFKNLLFGILLFCAALAIGILLIFRLTHRGHIGIGPVRFGKLFIIMCALLFLMIWAATYFYPWERLLEFFPKDIEEKAKQHKPPFPLAPVIGWILMALCMLGFIA